MESSSQTHSPPKASFIKMERLIQGIAGENIFYNKIDYEQSPLNRPLKSYAAGNSWASKPIENRYHVNTLKDSVEAAFWNMGVVGLTSDIHL